MHAQYVFCFACHLEERNRYATYECVLCCNLSNMQVNSVWVPHKQQIWAEDLIDCLDHIIFNDNELSKSLAFLDEILMKLGWFH